MYINDTSPFDDDVELPPNQLAAPLHDDHSDDRFFIERPPTVRDHTGSDIGRMSAPAR